MRQIFILLMLLGGFLTAQEPVSIHLTEKDGLPDKEFYGLVEDSKGFIWLAGNKGLTRFDGKNSKTYSHPDKRGLSVFEVNIDSKNRVWCVNISGQVFYVENDQMILFKDFKEELKGQLPQLVVSGETLVMRTTRKIFIVDIPSKNMETIDYNLNEININPFLFNNQILISEEDYIKFPNFEQRTVFRALPSFCGNTMQKMVYNQGKARMEAQGQVQPLEGDDAVALANQAILFPELTNQDEAELLGAERMGDQNVYVVKWSDTVKKFYNTDTNLLVAQETSAEGPQGPIKQLLQYQDYKEVDGVMFPMTLMQDMMGQTLKFEVKGIKVNSQISASEF